KPGTLARPQTLNQTEEGIARTHHRRHFSLALNTTFQHWLDMYCNSNILMSLLTHLVMSLFLA
ncbi:hypothetical protein, partial [Klebsiella pneumoniae]|uniref:hypothetical protein n=1 Tax=Klebsiella pneumoniae TaxID=573 RepID=UPI001AEF613F